MWRFTPNGQYSLRCGTCGNVGGLGGCIHALASVAIAQVLNALFELLLPGIVGAQILQVHRVLTVGGVSYLQNHIVVIAAQFVQPDQDACLRW